MDFVYKENSLLFEFLRKHVHGHADISKSEGGGDIWRAYLNSARSTE